MGSNWRWDMGQNHCDWRQSTCSQSICSCANFNDQQFRRWFRWNAVSHNKKKKIIKTKNEWLKQTCFSLQKSVSIPNIFNNNFILNCQLWWKSQWNQFDNSSSMELERVCVCSNRLFACSFIIFTRIKKKLLVIFFFIN